MDGGNTTFFFEDALEDDDELPNFFGTSAAAPHAAAIGALVLQAAGGPGSVKPNRMRRILKKSAFPHDLDPQYSSGAVQTGNNLLTISASGDQNQQAGQDPNFFTLWHGGPRRVHTFAINVAGANPTGRPEGLVFDEREDLGLPFVVGKAVGLDPSDVARDLLAGGESAGRRGPVEAAEAAIPGRHVRQRRPARLRDGPR